MNPTITENRDAVKLGRLFLRRGIPFNFKIRRNERQPVTGIRLTRGHVTVQAGGRWVAATPGQLFIA